MISILTPKSNCTNDELINNALEWQSRLNIERNKKRKIYCRIQISASIMELINRNVDINKVFANTTILNLYKDKHISK